MDRERVKNRIESSAQLMEKFQSVTGGNRNSTASTLRCNTLCLILTTSKTKVTLQTLSDIKPLTVWKLSTSSEPLEFMNFAYIGSGSGSTVHVSKNFNHSNKIWGKKFFRKILTRLPIRKDMPRASPNKFGRMQWPILIS